MMAEERNFRVQFYEKVGLREVEERRALEALLREEPVDVRRLVVWCRKCVVPQCWRPLVWQYLLEVTPRHLESQEYVRLQQRLTFEELWRTVRSLRLHKAPPQAPHSSCLVPVPPRTNGVSDHGDPGTPQGHHYVLMWLVSEARLLYNPQQQLQRQECRKFLCIARRMIIFYQDPVEVLHVSLAMWRLLCNQQDVVMEAISEATGQLRRENHAIHHHLLSMGLFATSLLTDLCMGLFYEVLPDTAAAKVIDKVATGNVSVLGYVVLALLLYLRQSLSSVTTVEGVASVLAHLRPAEAETVVSTALEYWARLGHQRRS